jgi:SAM-dependent methyltransferase
MWIAAVLITAALSADQHSRAPDVYFAPTWEPVVYEMLALAEVTRQDVVFDLGSGDGRILIHAAQQYGARGVGIELNPKLIEISRQVAQDAEVNDKVTFVQGDLFAADISTATVVTLYLSESINRELEEKLRRELRPGTRIVSHQFGIGRWRPDKTIRSSDGTHLFLWVVTPPSPRAPEPSSSARLRAQSALWRGASPELAEGFSGKRRRAFSRSPVL